MNTPLHKKSSVNTIRNRFDHDVERFSNLETGQTATIDAPLAMELITQAALAASPHASTLLDVGCGAGNNSIRLLQVANKDLDIDLLDISRPMLERAQQRVSNYTKGSIKIIQEDIRTAQLIPEQYDIILAAAVLHHLRDNQDWEKVFSKLYTLLKPGGSLWISDLISHENDTIQTMMWNRYGDYLHQLGGAPYRDEVFSYIDKEDSPRSLTFQLDLMKRVGFSQLEVLHKNSCFAAFGGIKKT